MEADPDANIYPKDEIVEDVGDGILPPTLSSEVHPSVRAQEQLLERARNGEPRPKTAVVPSPQELAMPMVDRSRGVFSGKLEDFSMEEILAFISKKISADDLFARILVANNSTEQIKLLTSDLVLRWNVLSFAPDEDKIGFFIDRQASYPELKMGNTYTIEHKAHTYTVLFLGAFYPSPDFRFALMSFFRKDPTTA